MANAMGKTNRCLTAFVRSTQINTVRGERTHSRTPLNFVLVLCLYAELPGATGRGMAFAIVVSSAQNEPTI